MKVGDRLWFVERSYNGRETGKGKELAITKVGRLYAYSQAEWRLYKIQLSNLSVTDERGDYDGQCYLSQEDHALSKLRELEWRRIHDWMQRAWFAPDDVTLEEILQLQVILKMRPTEIAPRPSRAERAYGEQQFFHD